ncbi:GNAT family N-acetyltransferase [Paracoccus albus]|uniref:GNAT family N-acetyltransferase n=1 Tax=Paracoccus albus TaxID=3017784 RepID=UPI0022F0ACBF|nr:GNAT family protein [Paracoccus albus]WBU59542.1 GNAT family protein [Paracoccus albus]
MSAYDTERPLGDELSNWQAPPAPGPEVIGGRYLRLERLNPDRHAEEIFAATQADQSLWDYMSNGPFRSVDDMRDWMAQAVASDAVFYAFVDSATGQGFGYASFMRMDAANGVLEIGNVMIGSAAQRSRAASEALMLMISWAFGAGYRRVEWKCNALNTASRRAARRYGFLFEGTFRNHMIIKGRNRDTAWFAMTDGDWERLAPAYSDWLAPGNFDENGRQRTSLSKLTEPIVRQLQLALSPSAGTKAGP